MNKISSLRAYLRQATISHKLLFFGKIIVAAIILYIIVNKIGANDIRNILLNSAPLYLLIALLLMPFNLFMQYLKWRLFCVNTLNESSRRAAFFSVIEGISIGLFTPARIGEIFGRKLSLHNSSLTQVTVMTIVDKLFSLFAIGFFGSLSMVLYLNFHLNTAPFITLSLLILVAFVFLFFYFLMMNEEYWRLLVLGFIDKIKYLQKIKSKFSVLKQLDRKLLVKATIFSIIYYLCFLFQYAFLAAAFAGTFEFYILLWAGALTFFTKTLIPSVSYGELGIREAISVFYLTGFGYTETVGFNSSITIFFINILIPSALGIIFLFLPDN